MRVKLTAKHPRPDTPDRAPVRSGSPSARKPARGAAAPRAAGAAPGKAAPARRAPAAKAASGARSAGTALAPRTREDKPGSSPVDKSRRPAAPGPRRATASGSSPAGASAGAPRGRERDGAAGTRRAAATDHKRTGAVSNETGTRTPRTGTGTGKRTAAAGDESRTGARAPRTAAGSGKRGGATGNESGTRVPHRTAAGPGKRPGAAVQARPERKTGSQVLRQPTQRAERTERAGRPEHRPSGAAAAKSPANPETAGTMRLSKRMSELGLCSRREADEWIANGWVRVDGERIDTLGARVRPDQQIDITRDAHAAQSRQVTILLHKPIGYVSGQAEDGYEPAVTLVTAANRWDGDRSPVRFSPSHLRALAPAGRLDIDSTGLLVLTQDGRIAKQLIGEQSSVEKEYLVRVTYGEHTTDVDKHFPADKLALLRFGLSLDGAALKPAKVSWQNGEQLRFALREGKKRQIRRMCELVGLHVVGLKRVRMGRVALGALPQGKWRYLLADEAF
jgi:23S rRNA pseudouridine2604 synthase